MTRGACDRPDQEQETEAEKAWSARREEHQESPGKRDIHGEEMVSQCSL